MNAIKKILTWIGGVFVALIVLVIFVAGNASSFKEDNQEFVAKFMTDLSENWQTSVVFDRLSNSMIETLDTQKGKDAISLFSQLGAMKSIYDMEMSNYSSKIGEGNTGVILFKSDFENGVGMVKMTLVVKDDIPKVEGLYITISEIHNTTANI